VPLLVSMIEQALPHLSSTSWPWGHPMHQHVVVYCVAFANLQIHQGIPHPPA
jgi:hypothetical protein